MARIRSVHPEICTSETIEGLGDPDLEVTFVRLWTHCDDEGRCPDNLLLIKAAIYPLRERATPQVLDRWLDRLHCAGLLMRYEVAGKRYVVVRSFGEYQHPNRPKASKYPAPPPWAPTPPDNGHVPVTDGTVTGPATPGRGAPDPVDAPNVQEPGPLSAPDTRAAPPPGDSPPITGSSDASLLDHARDTAGGEREREREREGSNTRAPHAPRPLTVVPDAVSSPTATVLDHPPDFETFWLLYPRKVAKREAHQAYKAALGHAGQSQLMAGLRRSITAWQHERRAPSKIPHAATWLRGRRWEDEPDTAPTHPPAEPKGYPGIRAALAAREARGTA